MSITIPPSMQSSLDSGFTTFCTLILITRLDGVQFAFTDLDKDIIFNSITYRSKSGFSSSAIQSSSGLAVDNVDFDAIIDDETITEEDLKLGLFTGASIIVYLVDYNNVSNFIILRKGSLGDLSIRDNGSYYAEVRGLSNRLQTRIGFVYTPLCNVRQLGDSRCKKSLVGFSFITSVLSVTNNRVFTHNTSVQANGFFNYGLIEWLSGSSNSGSKIEVKEYTVSAGIGTFKLQLPMSKTILPGDSFRAIAGCDRRADTCKNKFNNLVNFRGFPDLPGLDEMLKSGS